MASSMRRSVAASFMATTAIRRSYSYMPMERMPVTSNARIRGITPTRRDIALCNQHHHPIADFGAEFLGQRLAQNHAILAGDEVAQATAQQVRLQVDDAPLGVRQYAAQQDARGFVAMDRACLDLRYRAPRRRLPGNARACAGPAASPESAPRDRKSSHVPSGSRFACAAPLRTRSSPTAPRSARRRLRPNRISRSPRSTTRNRASAKRADSAVQ